MNIWINDVGSGPNDTHFWEFEDHDTLLVLGMAVEHADKVVSYMYVDHHGIIVFATAPTLDEARCRIEEEYDHHHEGDDAK